MHRQAFRAEYHEVDSMGFAYYGMYFNWFTRGRIGLLRELGMRYADWEREGLFLPVLRAECQYHMPVQLDDPVELETRLVECRRTRMRFVYRVFKGGPDGGGPAALCAEGATDHAFIDGRRRPIDVRKHFPAIWASLTRILPGGGA